MSLLRSLKLARIAVALLLLGATTLFAAEGPELAATCSLANVNPLTPQQVELTLNVHLRNHSKSDVTVSNLNVRSSHVPLMRGRLAPQATSTSALQIQANKTNEIIQQVALSSAEYKAFQAGHALQLSVTHEENGRMVTQRIPLRLERGKVAF